MVDQREYVEELEEYCRQARSNMQNMTEQIRSLELAQFEMTETIAQSTVRGSDTPLSEARSLSSMAPSLQGTQLDYFNTSDSSSKQKIQELERLVEKERHSQRKHAERIAQLEADLTLTRAELTLAQLLSNP